MKKRMLALLLTLCLVLSLLPAQSVVAEGEQTTYTVTIEGNGSQFVLKQNGTAITGLVSKTTVSVPVGSSLGAEGYTVEEWDRDTQYFVAWNIAGTDLGDDAAMLNYVINSDLTFTAGWVGVGGGEGSEGSETSGYYVKFDGYHGKGTFTVSGGNQVGTIQHNNATPNETIGDFLSFEITKDPEWGILTFGGWYQYMESTSEGTVYHFLMNETVRSTEEVMAMAASNEYDNMVFIAKWNEIPMSYYYDYDNMVYEIPTEIKLGDSVVADGDVSVLFTPEETAEYVVYSLNEESWTPALAYVWGSGNTEMLEYDYLNNSGTDGAFWALEADVTYELQVSGQGETYYLQKVVEPESLAVMHWDGTAFPNDTITMYAYGGMDLPVKFSPDYSQPSSKVSLSSSNEEVAFFDEGGYMIVKGPGEATVTVSYGTLTDTVNVESLAPIELSDDGTTKTGTVSAWGNLDFGFTAPMSGNYLITVTADKSVNVSMKDENVLNSMGGEYVEGLETYWGTEESDEYEIGLEGGMYYVIQLREDEGTEIGVSICLHESNMSIQGNEGTFTMSDGETTNGCGFFVNAGKTLADYDVTISDPVFWDANRGFKGWKATTREVLNDDEGNRYEEDVQIEGTSLMTTEEMLAYPAREDGKSITFIAQWEGDDEDYYKTITLNGVGGEVHINYPESDQGVERHTDFSDRFRLIKGGKIFDSIPWVLLGAIWEGEQDFEGWLEYNHDTGELISEELLTTEDLVAKDITDYHVLFAAKWDGIPMDDYKTMFQNGSGDDGEQSPANVEINANFGEVLLHGANHSAGAHDINVEPGKSMADVGEKIDDPVYWANRTFTGWIVTTAEELTDEEGNTYWDDVQIPGTKLMTTAEMLAYKTPADGTRIKFVAQWEGDDSDYFSDVGFETLDGILTMQHPDGGTDETTAPGQRCKEDGTKISQQIEWTIPADPVHPEFQFEGWLEYNEEEGMILVSETLYTTAQVFDKTVPSYNVRFVAKWDGIPMDDYKTMFQGGNDEEEPDFEISEDGTVILDATTPDAAEGVSSVELPVAAMEEMLAEDVKQVMIEMDSAAVIIDAAALAAIAEQADGATITLSVEEVATNTLTQKQQAVLEQKDVALVLTALILSDGEPIGDFKGGSITVAVPFELPAGDNAEDYNVWYVANDGTMEKMDTSYADGMLFFITKHFSDYVVIKTTQTDEEDKDNSGVGESTPEPEDPTQPTEPKPTEPKPTEPKPTEPKPTEPTKPTNPAVPDTADTADIMGLMTLMLASGAVAMALWLSLRKRNAA